jgi:hypothetical protein
VPVECHPADAHDEWRALNDDARLPAAGDVLITTETIDGVTFTTYHDIRLKEMKPITRAGVGLVGFKFKFESRLAQAGEK